MQDVYKGPVSWQKLNGGYPGLESPNNQTKNLICVLGEKTWTFFCVKIPSHFIGPLKVVGNEKWIGSRNWLYWGITVLLDCDNGWLFVIWTSCFCINI